MKQNWTYKEFEDCIEKVKYTTKLQSKDYLANGEYPIVSQEEELISGYWNNVSDVFSVERPLVIFGDHTRVLKYVDFDFVLGADGVKILLPIKELGAKFLYYFLKWYNVPNLGYSRHYKLLKEISLPIPPLSIQESIVKELDAIHGILEKKQEQLRELDNLAQAIFYDMFGDPITNPKQWEVKKLGEVCDVRDGTHDSPKYLPSSEYILITSKNIVNGEIDFSVSNYINREDFEAINRRSRVDVGDIIMPMIGTIGNPIIIKPTEKKFCIKNVALIKFANAEEVINVYIRELLDSPSYIGFLKSINQGGTQKFIALGTIRKLSIPLPPLSLQQSFAAKIEAIEAQKTAIRQSIREVEALLAERMDAYFS